MFENVSLLLSLDFSLVFVGACLFWANIYRLEREFEIKSEIWRVSYYYFSGHFFCMQLNSKIVKKAKLFSVWRANSQLPTVVNGSASDFIPV